MFMLTLSTALLLTTLFWAQNLWAIEKKEKLNENPEVQKEAADFIQRLANKALTSLKDSDSSIADQEVRFRGILLEGFDVNYIGKISLGRHRKQATKANLDHYYALFPEYLVKVYTSRLTKLDTREVRVGKTLPNGKRDLYIRTKVIDGEEKSYDVDWRVRPVIASTPKDTAGENAPEERRYKIIDVKIEGISMARTQRDDFSSRIAESGMSGLISFMQSIVNNNIIVADDSKENDKTELK
ncbi:MAG: ABC transporter substrate-binding protein [Emcibacter sp.]|nr:ABC transporter substrate-binding protein [Emcibacter sp.]